MHPLDEAEAFAKLAAEQAKGVEAIACEFGVKEHYVKQRMKLANLLRPCDVSRNGRHANDFDVWIIRRVREVRDVSTKSD